jgi:hypothetical protein
MPLSAILAAGCLILNFSLLSGFCSAQRSELKGDSVCGAAACEALFDLATSEDDFVRCAYANALGPAIANLGTKSTVVLDLVALTTLRLLGITRQVLTSGER